VYLSSQYPFDVFNELVGHHHDEMANTKPHSELEQKKKIRESETSFFCF